jgi:hypothetical protein
MNASQNTNMVTISNVNYMKFHIFNMTKQGYNVAEIFQNIEMTMSHFNYESEYLETIVFEFLFELLNEKLSLLEKQICI